MLREKMLDKLKEIDNEIRNLSKFEEIQIPHEEIRSLYHANNIHNNLIDIISEHKNV